VLLPYFAYGSNLDHDRLESRLGEVDRSSARRARLEGHRLTFDKLSRTAGGAATVEPRPGAVVEGVLWDLLPGQLDALDRIEGVPVHYRRRRVDVVVGSAATAAWAYVAHPDRVRSGLRPTAAYLGHLLRGEHWLSPAYLDRLRGVETDG
jgi:gamma-glutamylcyclotransferase (GGCT)/AIG2-like uncharacterized protein YtfP